MELSKVARKPSPVSSRASAPWLSSTVRTSSSCSCRRRVKVAPSRMRSCVEDTTSDSSTAANADEATTGYATSRRTGRWRPPRVIEKPLPARPSALALR